MYNKILSVYALCVAEDNGIAIKIQGVKLTNGSGNIILTGNVGELVRDSVLVCKTLLSNISIAFLDFNYHLHFEYIQVKKDGASCGLACFILLCMLFNIRLCHQAYPLAATGEIDLYGNVIPIKYLDIKIASAPAEIQAIFIPQFQGHIVHSKKIYQVSNVVELIK